MPYQVYKIKSVAHIPLSTLNAVYYITEEDRLYREPILFLAVVKGRDSEDDDRLELLTIDKTGLVSPCDDADNFLGIEYHNEEVDWMDEIEMLKRRRMKKKGLTDNSPTKIQEGNR